MMTERLEKPVKVWHLILTALLSASGAVFAAGWRSAESEYRLRSVEVSASRVPRMERMIQRIGDKLNVSFEGIE